MGKGQEGLRGHMALVIVTLVVAAAVFVGYLAISGAILKGDSYRVRVVLPTTSSLAVGSRVTMAGARVGRVASIKTFGRGTLVALEVSDDRVAPIPADSQATLRQRTPVGENYIALQPGSSAQDLPDNGVLPLDRSDEYVDVDEILSTLRGRTKQQAQAMIRNTGYSLDGRGDEFNQVLGGASEVVQSSAHVFIALHDNQQQVMQVIDRLGRISAAIGEREAAIRQIADRGLVALQALASRDAALGATLEVLPSTLRQVHSTSDLLRSTARAANPVVGNLAGAMRDLRPALTDLAPAASSGRALVAELGRAAPPLTETLAEVDRLSEPLSDALPSTRKALCQLNPMVRYIAPYTKDVLSPVIGLGSSSNSYDAIGHLIRLQPILNDNSISGSLPDAVSEATYTLLRSGLFIKGMGLSWNPLPPPGVLGTQKANGDGGNIFDADALRESGYKYPRIHADC
jgi:phospholipid/cholesterol/gamma-HCH transport system substrate-binding protein